MEDAGQVLSLRQHDYHQQYLHKNSNGYRCHSNTGVPFPTDV
jgi:peptide methionine sulfoxide reductase MsrA